MAGVANFAPPSHNKLEDFGEQTPGFIKSFSQIFSSVNFPPFTDDVPKNDTSILIDSPASQASHATATPRERVPAFSSTSSLTALGCR